MSLSYTLREGLANFRRARFATIASTSAMSVALVLIGLFGLLAFEAQQVSTWLKQRVGEVELFLEDVDEPVAQAIFERTRAMPGVEEADYISRAEAETIFRATFGDAAEIFSGENFLPASIRVRVKSVYANADSLTRMVAEFETWNRVDEVVFNRPLLMKVQQNIRLFTITGLSLGVLVVLASLFLVGNTIRLTIYARRLLIRTMKLVGATDSFVRQPFIVEGVLQGLIAGAVAALLLFTAYSSLAGVMPQLEAHRTSTGLFLIFGVLFLGVLLGWLGSVFAVRRFIRQVALH
jgi:cell division transport system permease protein